MHVHCLPVSVHQMCGQLQLVSWHWSKAMAFQWAAMSQLAAPVSSTLLRMALSVCTLAMKLCLCVCVRITRCFWLFIVLIITAARIEWLCLHSKQYPLQSWSFTRRSNYTRKAGNNLLPVPTAGPFGEVLRGCTAGTTHSTLLHDCSHCCWLFYRDFWLFVVFLWTLPRIRILWASQLAQPERIILQCKHFSARSTVIRVLAVQQNETDLLSGICARRAQQQGGQNIFGIYLLNKLLHLIGQQFVAASCQLPLLLFAITTSTFALILVFVVSVSIASSNYNLLWSANELHLEPVRIDKSSYGVQYCQNEWTVVCSWHCSPAIITEHLC